MAMELIGTLGMTVGLKQTYDKTLISRAVPELVHTMFGRKKSIPRRGGKSVEWRRLDTIASSTTALTEGTPPSATQATYSNVACTVQQYGQYTQISDILETQNFDPVIQDFSEAYGETMGKSMDEVVRAILVAGTTVQYASTTASRGGVGSAMFLDSAEIREAVKTLRRANVKPLSSEGNMFACIIHPDTSHDLFSDSVITNAFQYAQPRGDANPLFTGLLGSFHGVRFFETTQAHIFSSAGLSGADVYATLIIGQDSYGVTDLEAHTASLIIKPRGSGGTSDPLNQFSTIGYKFALAAAILDQTRIVRIENNTSQSLAA
jgi:N4-gp56 family major capsid protein